MEPTIYQAVKESIDLGEDDPYYNSGVLLVDLKQWREQESRRSFGVLEEQGWKTFCQRPGCDQWYAERANSYPDAPLQLLYQLPVFFLPGAHTSWKDPTKP